MKAEEFGALVADIRSDDPEISAQAAASLNSKASAEDFPKLSELLKDPDFVVREAAAWPLCEKGGPENLSLLLDALQMGFDEGHDNDGLQAAITDLAMLNKEGSKAELLRLKAGADRKLTENIDWLLEFCE